MRTLDEAIAKEKEEAKRLRKIIETGYDGEISIEAMFCDDTDAIKEAYERFENCAKKHEQYAEWLEELKAYREIGTVEECRNSVLDIERAYNKGYADGSLSVTEEIRGKAIDDFVNACKEDILCQSFGLHTNGIERIAEQLNAGGKNGKKKYIELS